MFQISKTLQVGITEFSKFQTRNFVYVDKTDLIGILATQYSDQVFLSRPRRFGKTLLTNMLRTLFQEGVSQFKGLKIEKLWQLATQYSDQVFLSRPRRFGKTLLTNMLRTLFQEGVSQFKGLKIEKLWHEQTYDVVQLDFSKSPSSFKTVEEFKERFWNYIQAQFASIGYRYDPQSVTHPEFKLQDC